MQLVRLMVVWITICFADALECYYCANVNTTDNCQTMTTCEPKENCFTQSYGSGSQLFFQLGCRPHDQCVHHATQSPPTIVGRSVSNQSSCSHCCSVDGCNKALCAFETQLINEKGPCEDDPKFDCVTIGSALDVCGDVQHAKLICKKYCGLCNIRWNVWSNWSVCSTSCGVELQKRTRTCSSGNKLLSGSSCVGTDIDTQLCTTRSCRLDNVDCLDVRRYQKTLGNGVYNIRVQLDKPVMSVYCDMTTAGGGWTVFQKRLNGSLDFYRDFKEYEEGFGDINAEFWMGLRHVQDMTSSQTNELRIDVTAADGTIAYETYQNFTLSPGPDYTLHIGQAAGTAGDGLSINNGYRFSTKDKDVDGSTTQENCTTWKHGGWWYNDCSDINLNGDYATPGTLSSYHDGHGDGGVVLI